MSALALADFQARAREPRYWQETARNFAIAANYLGDWYDADSGRYPSDLEIVTHCYPLPMMVLYAVAAENLLKAIKVARGQDPVPSGRLDSSFAHHDLIRHATDLHLSLTTDQETLLRHLRDVVESDKYPVAKSPAAHPTAWHLRFPKDVEDVWSLLEMLEDLLIASSCPTLPKWNFRIRYRPVEYPKP